MATRKLRGLSKLFFIRDVHSKISIRLHQSTQKFLRDYITGPGLVRWHIATFISFHVTLWEGNLNFQVSVASMVSNYGSIFSFPNKLKFNILKFSQSFLLRSRKLSTCPSNTKISLKSYLWKSRFFTILNCDWMLPIF